MAEMTSIRVRVIIDEFFTRSKSGAVWGRIYFEIGDDQFFPNKEWTDLVAAFSRGWLAGLLQIADRATTKERIPFYDGPFFVDASVSGPGVLDLKFCREEVVKHSASAGLRDSLQDAISISEQLLGHCRSRGWANADTEILETLVTQGTRVLANF